jgi:hypothetical protein
MLALSLSAHDPKRRSGTLSAQGMKGVTRFFMERLLEAPSFFPV